MLMALLILLHHRQFSFRIGRRGRQEEAAAGRALNTEGFFVSKRNSAVAAGKCICESAFLHQRWE